MTNMEDYTKWKIGDVCTYSTSNLKKTTSIVINTKNKNTIVIHGERDFIRLHSRGGVLFENLEIKYD